MSTVPCPLQFVINNGDDEGEAVYTMIISSPGGLSRYFMVVVAEDGWTGVHRSLQFWLYNECVSA